MKKILFIINIISISLYAASIEDGINWLKSKQNTNGSWGDPQKLGFLETIEVLNTFITLSETTGVEKGLNYLENQFPENTDFWARKLSLFARTNRDFYFLLQQLLQRKNTDGGFGFLKNYQSTIWETILSFEALKDAGLNINEIFPTLNFILIHQNTDGGFGFFIGDSSRTLPTAYCTYILSNFRGVSGVNPAINRGVEWLLQKQNPDSGFGDEGSTIYETAIAWLALRSVDMGDAARKMAFQYIASHQDQNGGWDNSIYNTALALRVIQEGLRPNLFTAPELITFTPEQPNKGDTVLISAKIINNGDGESPSSVIQFSYGTNEIGEVNIPTVLPQDTAIAEINWSTVGIAGFQTITVNIDPENLIKELSEEDNIASKQIFIQDTMPPETLNIWVSNPYFSPNNDGMKDYTRIYFTASEDVTVSIFVKDYDFNVIKTIILNEFYSPGRYSVVWDGTTDEGTITADGDYLFEVRLVDMGNNLEIRNAFVCVDLNKTTIFASLDPNRIKVKKVWDGYPQEEWGSNYHWDYYPETDQFFFCVYDTTDWESYYLILSNAKRTYFDTLDGVTERRGFRDINFVPAQQKLYYCTPKDGEWYYPSPIYRFDLNTHTKTIVVDDSCNFFIVSPDGGRIAFVRTDYNDWTYDLLLGNSDGTNQILIEDNFSFGWSYLRGELQFSWSGDGQYLLYYHNYYDTITGEWIDGIWRVSRDGLNKSLILPHIPNCYPSNSGHKIAFIPIEYDEINGIWVKSDSLCLINLDGTGRELLAMLPEVPPPPPPLMRVEDLIWSPDNSEILLLNALIIPPHSPPDTLLEGVYRINVFTKEAFKLPIFLNWGYWYYGLEPQVNYSENGKRFVYIDTTGYFCTCNLLGEEKDSIVGPEDMPGWDSYWGLEWPIDFTANYTEFIHSHYHYGFTLNNLLVEITALSRLAQTPDMLTIMGTVFDRNLEKFTVEYGVGQNPSQFFPIYEGDYCIDDTIITAWVPPTSGYYAIRLTGIDKAGNVLRDVKVIDWEWQTVITDLRAIPDFISPDGDGINDFTTISYYLVHPEPLNFKIRNQKGAVIRNFYEYHEEPGSYSFIWNGKDNFGNIVPDGIYKVTIFGMSIPVRVDSAYPIAKVGATSGFRGLHPVFAINALAYDGNLTRFILEYAHKDTSEFTTLLIGNYPAFKTKPGDTTKYPDTLVYLDLRNCVGKNHLRLTVEDRAGHKKIARDSVFVDSLAVGCIVELIPQIPRLIDFTPAIAMVCLPNVSQVKFSFRPLHFSTHIEIGDGIPYPGEDFLYYRDTLYSHPDTCPIWLDSLAWLKVEVSYQNGHKRSDSTLFKINPSPPGDTKRFVITQPPFWLFPDSIFVLSLIAPIEANFLIQPPPPAAGGLYPEYLDRVWFSYFADNEWHNIGTPIDSSPFRTNWNTILLPDGIYTLRADGIDTLGVSHYCTGRVRINNSTPIVCFLAPANNSWLENDTIIWVEAFPHPGAAQFGAVIDYVEIQYIAGADTIILATDSAAPYTANFPASSLPDGLYKLRAKAYDSFGHIGSATINVFVDRTRPIALITNPLNGAHFINEDFIDVYGRVFDEFLKIYCLDYQLDNGSWSPIADSNINIEGLLKHWDVRALASGNYNLRLYAFDHIGHSDTSIISITIENSPAPTVELTHPLNDSFIKDTCSIVGKVQDDNLVCWILSYGMGLSPSEWIKIDSNTTNFEGQFILWNTKLLEDTIYTIKLWAIDEIGRTNERRITITTDNTLPTAEITYPNFEQYVGVPIAIIGTASDRNFANYLLEIGKGINPNFWTPIKVCTTQVIEDTLGKLNPLPGIGWWTIRLTVKDKVENISQRQVSIVIDTLPPAPPTGLALQDSLQQVILTWNPNTEPDLAGYNAYRQNAQINTATIPSPFYLDSVFCDGHYVYCVTALDWFDLESDPSDTVSVDVDITKPIVAIYEPYNNQRIHGIVEIIGTANDNHFKSYTLMVGQGLNPENWQFLNQSFTPVIFGRLGTWNTEGLDSIWTIKLKAEDTFNNKDSTTITVFVDNLPPAKPQGLVASTNYDTVQLNWLPNPEPDLAGYRLFRNGILVNPAYLITDTFYLDRRPDGFYSYYLIAEDLAENISESSDSVVVEVDIRAPHAIIIHPHQGERVTDTVTIQTYVEDNDVKDARFEFKLEYGLWQLIGIDSLLPFTMDWVTDTLIQGKYYLKAVAKDYHNNIDPKPESIYVFVVKDLEPPSPPQGLVASVTNDTIYLDWQANQEPDLAGYNVYQHFYGEIYKLNDELIPDTHYIYVPPWPDYYYFSITAVDTATNESEHSAIAEVDYANPDVWISKPEDGQRIKNRVAIIGTVYDENLTQYILSYSLSDNPVEWETLTVDSQNVLYDTLASWYTGNLPDSFYTIKLEAVDENGNYSEHTISVYVDHTPPAPPQNLVAELLPDSTIYLHWDPNSESDLQGYNLYYSTVSGTGYVRLNLEIIGWNEYWVDLPGGKTYYFVATAVDLVDNESGYSNEASISTPVEDIDLAIAEDDIIIYPPSPVVGETALIVATVHNLGTQNATNVKCDFFIKYQGIYHYLGQKTIPEIPGNSSQFITITWYTSGYPGIDTVCVLVDPSNLLIETNEDNNIAFKEVIVRPSDIVFEISLDDTLYEPNTDLECLFKLINFCPQSMNFLSRFSILDSLQDTLNSKYEIESFVYVDDTIPQGSIPLGDFYWDTTLFYKETKSITHAPQVGEYEYGFYDAQELLRIEPNHALVQYVYLSADNPPSEIMLEFQDTQGSKEHRAYWGANLINRGINNTAARRYLGELPQPGRWVRLVVPAETIGLANKEIKGISYVLYNGRANWDFMDLGLRNFSFSLNQGDSLKEKLYWNTKNTPGGLYQFLATLSFNNQTMIQAKPFRILSIPGLIVDVYTNKIQYTSNENVTITSVITNQSPNYTYENITENIVLRDTFGMVFYDTTRNIAILLECSPFDLDRYICYT